MKLHEILKEGVFDSVKKQREATDLSVLVKATPRQLTMFLKQLPDEEFLDLYTKQRERYMQMMSVYKNAEQQLQKIKRTYPDDVETYVYKEPPPDFEIVEILGPTGAAHGSRKPYQYKTTFAMRSGSEAKKESDKVIKRLNHYRRLQKESSLTAAFDNESKRRKKEVKKTANTKAAGIFAAWSKAVPPTTNFDVPDKLPKPGKTKPTLYNPATYQNATETYVGHPAHFPEWSNDWKRRVIEMEEALIRNGKKGFEVMYASRINKGDRKQPRGYFNFFIIGANGDFVWRKYQTSGANGGNWVYIKNLTKNNPNGSYKGDRMQTTNFEAMSKERQDEIINQI